MKHSQRISCWLLAWLLLLASPGRVWAQERFGALAGTVRDDTGAVLAGALVEVWSHTTERATSVTADAAGAYHVDDLEPGHYRVRFEMAGFAPREVPDVTVLLGRTASVDGALAIGGLAEAVEVVAAPSRLIDIRDTTVAHNVTEDEFSRLPKTRSFVSLAALSPSVSTGVIEGGFQVNGASGAENTFTVDGVATGSLYNGRSRQDTAFEYLQEVRVKTAGIQAEFGGAMGGVISAVTKSGGNTMHGEAHAYYEGSALSAAPPARLVLSPVDDKTVAFVQDATQTDHRYEPGASLGGPIVRNRLFFFGSVSPRLVRRENVYGYSDGAEPGTIAQRQTVMQAFGKVSAAWRRMNASASVLWTPTDSVGTLPGYTSLVPNAVSSSRAGNAANASRGFQASQLSGMASFNLTLSNSSFLAARLAWFTDRYSDTGIPAITSVTYQTSAVGYGAVPASMQLPIGTQNTPRALDTTLDRTGRTEFAVDYSRVFHAWGAHSLKAGAGLQRSVSDANAAYPGGYVLVYWNRSFSFGGASGRGTYGYYEVDDRGFTGTAGANATSVFVQDSWQIGERLTLDLGVRTETERIPTYRPDLQTSVLEFGPSDRVAPRLGFSYTADAGGRLKVYGSWGRYFDWTKYSLARNALGSDFWKIYYRSLDTLDIASLSLGNMPGTDLWVVPGSYRDQAVPGFDRVDRATKPTYQDSLSLGLERQLSASSVVTVHYVHNDLRRVVEDVGTVLNGNRVLSISNPAGGNATTMAATGLTAPFATPPVTRLYDAVEIGLSRRLSGRWFGGINYTWSRLWGNYSGLASSDEIRTPTTGGSYQTPQAQDRSIANPGGALRTYWNIDEVMWDAHGNLDLLGRLATDRPHAVKLFGAYGFPSGTQVGVQVRAASGTPISTYVNTTNQTEVFVNGRGDMGRTPALSQADLLVSHEIPFRGGRRVWVELNVLNLFNQKAAVHLFNYLNRGGGAVTRASSAIDLSRVDLSKGYDYNALLRATPDGANAWDPRYGLSDLFADGTRGQLMVKFVF